MTSGWTMMRPEERVHLAVGKVDMLSSSSLAGSPWLFVERAFRVSAPAFDLSDLAWAMIVSAWESIRSTTSCGSAIR